MEGAAANYGTIDVAVINPGYEGEYQLIQDATIESYHKVFDVNVFGAMYVMKYAARELLKHESGAIVKIGSNGSFTGAAGHERLLLLQACGSRHDQVRRSGTRPQGIHVNYICPGGVETR